MARPKGKKIKRRQPKVDNDLVEIVEEEIEFNCPVRGRIKQKVKVKRLKAVKVHQLDVVATSDAAEAIDAMDDGLEIYSNSEEEVE